VTESLPADNKTDERVLAAFFRPDGTLHTIPTKRTKRLVVLDHLSQAFEPGRRYTEAEVSTQLEKVHPDYAALRRYLVDDQFLAREGGEYWRVGGQVDV
jgi:hypothetical protein